MTMKVPVSVCMITRDDPHLADCIKSFMDYVEEINVVITSDHDDTSISICRELGANYTIFTECNVDDRIVDFSMARNKSLDMATQPWIMWIDSDDILIGADKIQSLIDLADSDINQANGICYLFPYEYSYGAHGAVTCRQYRERLAKNKNAFHFINPVHECLAPKPNLRVMMINSDELVFKHRRQFNAKMQDPGRNLRILEHYMSNHDETDPNYVRNLYYIGLEYDNNQQPLKAIENLTKYLSLSGWDDEMAMACIRLCQIHERQGLYTESLKYAFELLKLKHNWFESYFWLCKIYYLLNKFDQSAHYGLLALQQPPTQTLLFVNQLDRAEITLFLNVALNNVGKVQQAYEVCVQGLQGLPDHPNLLNNKRIYEQHLGVVPEQEEIGGIVFVTAPGPEQWSPDSARQRGIGGSETMLIAQAANLAKLGHRVTVYAACDGYYDGVEYRNVAKFRDIKCDTLIVSRYAQYLSDVYNVSAQLKLLWCHDVMAHNATNELLLKADKILALSQWHKQNLVKMHHVHPDTILVTRNGIDLNRFSSKNIKRDKYKCVNSSSPDRSWPVLLSMWPKIKAAVPEASLHLYYGFHNWKVFAQHDPNQLALIKSLEEKVKELESLDVVFHDRISQDELAKEFLSAGVWLYPTFFSETSCITAMEAQAAGLHIVASNIAALSETVRHGTLIDGEWTSPEYQEPFILSAIAALTAPEEHREMHHGAAFDLVSLAKNWSDMITQLHHDKETNPLNPYYPTPKYLDRKTKTPAPVKLNIGCGTAVFPYDGWRNFDHADFDSYFNFIKTVNHSNGMPAHQAKLWEYVRQGGELHYTKHDMTQPFTMIADNSVDYIYLGQSIEHLHYTNQAPQLMLECFRMLKKGGIIRLTTPDLNKLLVAYRNDEMYKFNSEQPDFYKDLPKEAQLPLIMFGASGENCNQHHYEGHFFIYSEKTMQMLLEQAGFSEIEFTYPKCGRNKEIALEIEDFGFSHSMIVEAVK